jgi:hypothetical protein
MRTGTGTSQQDTAIERISVSTYAQQTNKNTTGRPTQIFVQRLPTSTTVTLWPVPDANSSYTLFFYRLKGIDGLASGVGGDITNIPPRFVPALVAGLAYYIAMKKPEVERRVMPLESKSMSSSLNLLLTKIKKRLQFSSFRMVPSLWGAYELRCR